MLGCQGLGDVPWELGAGSQGGTRFLAQATGGRGPSFRAVDLMALGVPKTGGLPLCPPLLLVAGHRDTRWRHTPELRS